MPEAEQTFGRTITLLTDRRMPSLLVGCAVNLLYASFVAGIAVVKPHVESTFHLSNAAGGQLFLFSFGGTTLGVLLCGAASDKYGRKRVLLLSMLLFAAGAFLLGTAHNFVQVLMGSPLLGGGAGAMQTVANAGLTDLFPRRKEQALSITQFMYGAGAFIGPIVMLSLFRHNVPWPLFYQGMCALGVGLLLIQAVLRVPDAEAHAVVNAGSPWRSHSMLLLGLMALLYSGAEVAYWGELPNFTKTAFHSDAPGTLAVSFFWLAMAVGRFFTGFIITRYSLRRMMAVMMLAACIVVLPASFLATEYALLLQSVLAGLTMAGVFSILLSLAAERFSQDIGAALGVIAASAGAGGALLPWIASMLATDSGWHAALLVAPVSALLVAGLAMALKEKARTA